MCPDLVVCVIWMLIASVGLFELCVLLQGGWTALMMASEKGKTECVKALLRRGAKVNIENKVSSTKTSEMSMCALVVCVCWSPGV